MSHLLRVHQTRLSVFGYLLLLWAWSPAVAQSPPGWAWAKRVGSFSNQTGEENKGRGIGTDAAGNVYMLGEFTGTITLEGLSATSAGQTDIFLAKYTPEGSLLWLRQLSSPSIESANNLQVDPAGNCTLTGTYGVLGGHDLQLPNGQTLAGPMSAGMPSGGSTIYGRFAFAASFDALGDVRWATRFTPQYRLFPNALAIDTQGNTYVSGDAVGAVTLAGQSYPALGSSDGFLLKFSNTGQIQWFRRAGASGASCSGEKVFTDNAGAVYWTYSADRSIQIGTTTGSASTPTLGAPIAKFSSSNRLLWIRSLSSASTGGIGLSAIDRTTNTLLAHGSIWNGATAAFAGYSTTITGPTGNDIGVLLATADTAGRVTWARQIATSPRNSLFFASEIVSATRNARQDIVATFIMEPNSPVTLSGYGVIATAQSGMLLAEYIPASNTVRSVRLAEMSANSYGNHAGTVVDVQNNILLAGSFMGTARFGATTLISTISTRRDSFFAKLDQSVLSSRKSTVGLAWGMYPNPTHGIVTVSGLPTGTRLRLTDMQGRTVRTYGASQTKDNRQLTVAPLPAGLYMLHAETIEATYTPQKLLVE